VSGGGNGSGGGGDVDRIAGTVIDPAVSQRRMLEFSDQHAAIERRRTVGDRNVEQPRSAAQDEGFDADLTRGVVETER